MKIEILKENLKSGLNIVEKAVGKNLSLPILDNVLIKIEDGFLSLTSTDLEAIIKLWILSKVIQKGTLVILAKFLSSFISYLPSEKIIIEARGQNLHIESKNFKTQIQGYNPEEFPIMPEFNILENLEIDNKKFCEGISQVINIISSSQIKPETSGIYFNFSKKNIIIASTDSFRLAEKTIPLVNSTQKEYSFILPAKPAREIINILGNLEGVLKIYFSETQVLFEFPMKEIKHPQIQITSRLIEGQYPNYQDIIPQYFKTSITLKKDEFLNQIKTASLFSNKNNEVKIIVYPSKKEVEIFGQNPNIGESKSSFSAKIDGDPIEVSFNYKFLIDGLLNIKSSEVTFNISKEDGPSILKPVGDSGYLYVVMPIKSI